MISRPKPRRKKVPEPLDWRELAEGPALRGLAEVLATPLEVARSRASKRTDVDRIDGSATPTVGRSPSVGPRNDFPAPAAELGQSLDGGLSVAGRSTEDEPPTEGSLPAIGSHLVSGREHLTVGDKPTAVVSPGRLEGDSPTVASTPPTRDTSRIIGTPMANGTPPEAIPPAATSKAECNRERPTAGDKPSVVVPPGEYKTGAVDHLLGSSGDSPTVVFPPTVPGDPFSTFMKGEITSEGAPPTVPLSTTVGVTPRAESNPAVELPRSAHSSESASSEQSIPTVGVSPTEGRTSRWADSAGAQYEGKRVHRVTAAQESMSLGEERVYLALWQASATQGVVTEGADAKLFTLGYDRIARVVRLNEKSVRLLLPKLISKQVLEILAAEHSASRTGRTYRIFSPDAILRRQQAANLRHIVKNGRAVEFVWPIG